MAYEPRREVVKEHEFEEQLAALIRDAEAADDYTAAAEYLLARDPQSGVPASRDQSIWQLLLPPIGGQSVAVFYTFDEHAVTLLAIVAF